MSYPNPQDVLPLREGADAAWYRRGAHDLIRANRSGLEGVRSWAERWVDRSRSPRARRAPSEEDVARYARNLADFAHALLSAPGTGVDPARFTLARAHGFTGWTGLIRHIESLHHPDSLEAAFERAVDAVVAGDMEGLERGLARHPALVHARSTREHRATLLHYASANGVENYRQTTPANVVEIARTLLDAGAEVDAAAEMYGGGSTTLGLVVTSAHPRALGVQEDLADLLLERGALMNPSIVRDCLANGCPEAGAFLADRGAPLGVVEAAGLGRVDVLSRLADTGTFRGDGIAALIMASWYGQRPAVEWLLDHGVDPDARSPEDGRTGLHVAAYAGHPGLVRLLLARGAAANVTDDVHGTPPLVWALHAWRVEGRPDDAAYRTVLHALVDAGARIDEAWIQDSGLRDDADVRDLFTKRAAGREKPPAG